MKETLEKLWTEYLSEEAAKMDTEEKRLTKTAVALHEKANDLLTKEQADAVEKYVDMLNELHAVFAKKAFCKGCEFAVSFLWEAKNVEK